MGDMSRLILSELDSYCNQFVLIGMGEDIAGEGSAPIYFKAHYKNAPAS